MGWNKKTTYLDVLDKLWEITRRGDLAFVALDDRVDIVANPAATECRSWWRREEIGIGVDICCC